MPFFIKEGDITEADTECIVISADVSLKDTGGMSGELYKKVRNPQALERECEKIGFCGSCECVTTNSYGLDCKYIIHCAAPIFSQSGRRAEEYIGLCYRNSISMAGKKLMKSVSLPLIGTGRKGFPKDMVIRSALCEIKEYLLKYDMDIFLVLKNRSSFMPDKELVRKTERYISENYIPAGNNFFNKDVHDKKSNSGLPCPEFSKILCDTLKKYKLKEKKLCPKANIGRMTLGQLINGSVNKAVSKEEVLGIAVAFESNADDVRGFVEKSGFDFSLSYKRDVIISMFMDNGNYDILQINSMLFYFGEKQIGSF